MPNHYSDHEDILNATSHVIPLVFMIANLPMFFSYAKTINNISSFGLYLSSIFCLFLFSALYHFSPKMKPYLFFKNLFLVLDHFAMNFYMVAVHYFFLDYAVSEQTTTFKFVILILCIGNFLSGFFLSKSQKKIFLAAQITFSILGSLYIGYRCFDLVMNFKNPHITEYFLLTHFGNYATYILAAFFYVFSSKKYMHAMFHLFVTIGIFITLHNFISMGIGFNG